MEPGDLFLDVWEFYDDRGYELYIFVGTDEPAAEGHNDKWVFLSSKGELGYMNTTEKLPRAMPKEWMHAPRVVMQQGFYRVVV